MTDEWFEVEVSYARPDEQVIVPLKIAPGTTLEQAIMQSGIVDRFAEIDLAKNKLGVFGKVAKKDVPLKPGDRVEIYRPLIADPKEARKKRAAEGKQMRKGGGREAADKTTQ